jgi:RimJ/RimL family protein N-acetyltransferase
MSLNEHPPVAVASHASGLIRADAPSRPRALAVLDGVLAGRAWVDDPLAPTAIVVIEDADGTIYAGGAVDADEVRAALSAVTTKSGDLIFGFASTDDPLRGMLPAEPYWRGEAIDFTDRHPAPDEAQRLRDPLPDGARLERLTRETLAGTEWFADTIHAFGSIDRWEEHGIGFAVTIGGHVVAESVAGPRSNGLLEMGVTTREDHRGKGFGTLASVAVARSAEERGDRVWWNTNAGNAPSIAIARRLGFRTERRYEVVACHSAPAS